MTNKNSSLKNRPFLLKPVGKDYLWGGNRLNDDFFKEINMSPLAETWECSTHPDGISIVGSGEYKGQLLRDVLIANPEYLGHNYNKNGDLPILIKFIDAKKDLSVQVHPNDEYAHIKENGALGKSEMWYVLDTFENSKLIYGFNRNIEESVLLESLKNGTVEKYLQKVPVKKDDIFYVPAGKVHGIGAGCLIAEIQENSNVTYRLYDYNRIDKYGNHRELHIKKALEVVDLKESKEPRQPMRVLKYKKGCAYELLCRCKYFQVERLLLNTERHKELCEISPNKESFEVLMCINGCGVLTYNDIKNIQFLKGDCIFLPSDGEEIKLHGKAQLLKVNC